MVKTVGLKTRPTALRRQVGRGEAVIVTRRGKPVAALTRLTDADLEEFVLRYTSRVAPDGGAPAPFGTIFVAYGPNGPLMVSQANSPAAFEREAERVLGSGPVADPEPPADLRAEVMHAIRDHAPYRGPGAW